MKFSETLIAYDPYSEAIKVGPLIADPDGPDWTDEFVSTTGAAYHGLRNVTGRDAGIAAASLFNHLVLEQGVDLRAAYKAFMDIDEFADVANWWPKFMEQLAG